MKCLHNLLKGISLTGALFVFQACYGMPQPALYETGEAPMSFSLVSKPGGTPLQGIRIMGAPTRYASTSQPMELGVTGPDGRCSVRIPYIRNEEGPFLTFEDPQGKYASKDTSLTDLREREIVVQLYPEL